MSREKGYKHSEETKKKISISSIGKKGTYGHLGKKHSLETKKRMSWLHKGYIPWNKDSKGIMKPNKTSFKKGHNFGIRFGRDKDYSGENHYNWQGGISKELYGRG